MFECPQAFDCGSGWEFLYPHLAAADREGPNKALANLTTVPMKVGNALVHGDTRGHVILSPGVIGATANHTCEMICIVVNTVLHDHATMPPDFTLQFDGASTNKCILTLAFISLYVMSGVFHEGKARCEEENHAHDVYDAWHAIHATRAKHATYFHHEELIGLIEASHTVAADRKQHRPIVGHDVRVGNLWVLRDFWEWLAPGYTQESTREYALKHAAFASFSALNGYRDFAMRLESGSTEDNPRVGLWAKAYMTSPSYEYLGTLLTKQSFDAVTKGLDPPLQSRHVSDQKTKREVDVVQELQKVSQGKFGKQFTPERVADAIAMSERNWAHFSASKGELPTWARTLPHHLGSELRRRGLRHNITKPMQPMESFTSPKSMMSAEYVEEQREASLLASMDPQVQPRALKFRDHSAADVYGFQRGDRLTMMPSHAKGPSDQEFLNRHVMVGTFVLTRSATRSHWAKASVSLRRLDFWLWHIVKVYEPGTPLPGFTKTKADYTYEAHLFQPVDKRGVEGRWEQVWSVGGPTFLRTAGEKHKRKQKTLKKVLKPLRRLRSTPFVGAKVGKRKPKDRPAMLKRASSDKIQKERPLRMPLRSYLRPDNIIGGGFTLTPTRRIPRFAYSYWQRHVKSDVHGVRGHP